MVKVTAPLSLSDAASRLATGSRAMSAAEAAKLSIRMDDPTI